MLDNFSLADYMGEHKLTHVWLYFLTKKKTSNNRIQDILDEEFSDSDDFEPEKFLNPFGESVIDELWIMENQSMKKDQITWQKVPYVWNVLAQKETKNVSKECKTKNMTIRYSWKKIKKRRKK